MKKHDKDCASLDGKACDCDAGEYEDTEKTKKKEPKLSDLNARFGKVVRSNKEAGKVK